MRKYLALVAEQLGAKIFVVDEAHFRRRRLAPPVPWRAVSQPYMIVGGGCKSYVSKGCDGRAVSAKDGIVGLEMG